MYTAASAMSETFASLPIGVRARAVSLNCSCPLVHRVSSMEPGEMAFTWISGAKAIAIERVRERMPALEAQYTIELPSPVSPAVEAILMMQPPAFSFIAGMAAREQRKTPRRLTSRVRFQTSSVMPSRSPMFDERGIACAIHQDIQPAQLPDHAAHHAANLGIVRNIGLQCHAGGSRPRDFRRRLFCFPFRPGEVNGDCSSLARKGESNCPPRSGPAAGYHGYSALESLLQALPPRSLDLSPASLASTAVGNRTTLASVDYYGFSPRSLTLI